MKELSKEELLKLLLDNWRQVYDKKEKTLKLHDEQAYEQIRQLIENQPEVDIIFIDKWVASIFLSLEHYIQENDINEANNQLEIHLRELLQEAGVKIKELKE